MKYENETRKAERQILRRLEKMLLLNFPKYKNPLGKNPRFNSTNQGSKLSPSSFLSFCGITCA